MTIHAVVRGGSLVPTEPLPFREGEELRLEVADARTAPLAVPSEGMRKFLETLREVGKNANPNFVWDRDAAYED